MVFGDVDHNQDNSKKERKVPEKKVNLEFIVGDQQ
jgi:hypothetical protein